MLPMPLGFALPIYSGHAYLCHSFHELRMGIAIDLC